MSWAAVIVGGATLTYSAISSASKNAKAKKLAKKNKRPVYSAGPEIDDVYNLAQSEMSNPDIQDAATQGLQLSQSAGIDAILKSGGRADFSTINSQYGGQLRGVLDSVRREKAARIVAYNNAAYNKAKSRDSEWQYNVDAPYKDTQQQIAALREQAAQAKKDAVNTGISAAANYGIATAKPGTPGGDVNSMGTLSGPDAIIEPPKNYTPTGPTEITPAPAIERPSMNPVGETSLVNPRFSQFGYIDEDGRQVLKFDEYNRPVYA